ncbi:hypothetical protein Misp02_70890 [Microtetraspora sp. NBRC 16547]|nr:hypothetical protein Misp02_70890 [Microtetraspora sp. NBRC 16547]
MAVSAISLIIIGLLFLAGWYWNGRLVEVDAAAVRQVRGVGTVVADVKVKSAESDVASTLEYIIFETPALGPQGSFGKVVDYFRERGWVVDIDDSPRTVNLKSSEWDAILILMPLKEFVDVGSFGESRLKKVAEDAYSTAKYPESIMVAILRPART